MGHVPCSLCDVYITSHSQSERDKRVYMEACHLNVWIHRDITGEMWFGVGQTLTLKVVQITGAGH